MSKLKTFFISLIIPLIFLVVWELLIRFSILPTTLIASPSQVIVDFIRLLLNGKLLLHSFVSLRRLVLGFSIGTFLGLLLGILVGVSKSIENFIAPTIQSLAPIPPIAWIPLLIIFLGIGEYSKIGLIVLAAFVIVYINTVQGIRSTSQKIIDLAKVYKKSTFTLIKKVLLPASSSNILTGMRIALGISWILLIAAEVIASSNGLGWLIWNSRNFSRPDDMIVGMIAIGILGKLSDMLLVAAEKRLTSWRNVFKGE